MLGAREWDQRNYRAPMKLSLRSLLDVLAHPAWLWRVMVPKGAPRFENLLELLPAGKQSAMVGARYMGTQINAKLSWEDMEHLRQRWKGKLVLKGILCVEDARRAAEIGADGVVLSNHGGRQVDSCVSGVELLPGFTFSFFGRMWDRVKVNSDGNLTFGESDVATSSRGLGRFVSGPPRIGPLFSDLNPELGSVGYRGETDGIVFVWDRVPDYNSASVLNSFSVKLFRDGRIEFAYGTRVAARKASSAARPARARTKSTRPTMPGVCRARNGEARSPRYLLRPRKSPRPQSPRNSSRTTRMLHPAY